MYERPFQSLFMSIFLRQVPHIQPQNILGFISRGMQDFHGQMNVFKSEMERWHKSGVQVMMLANGEERIERVRRILYDYDIESQPLSREFGSGFELPSIHLAVITEGEMFSRNSGRRKFPGLTMPNGSRVIRAENR
jgi:transcription-repair coupling factor (superfamily II helicase)